MSSFDDEAPPPSYAEQAYDRKISPALLSQTQIRPSQWEPYTPAAEFQGAVNARASANGQQQYGYHAASVKDSAAARSSASALPYKGAAPPVITPLRIAKDSSEFKTSGFYVVNEGQDSPVSPDDDAYRSAAPGRQPGSAGESSTQRSPTFNNYGAMGAPTSQYPSQSQSQPQTPRRPLPPRPSQQQQNLPPQTQAAYKPMSPHPSQPSHLSFDPSTAYARPPPQAGVASVPYDPLSLYNSAVSSQMNTPRRTQPPPHVLAGRPHLNEFSPSRTRPESIYSVATTRSNPADESDRFSVYSSATSAYTTHSAPDETPWYPNRR